MGLNIEWFLSRPLRASKVPALASKNKRGYLPGFWDVVQSLRQAEKHGGEVVRDTVAVVRAQVSQVELGAVALDDRLGDPSLIIEKMRKAKSNHLLSLGGDLKKTVSSLAGTKKTAITGLFQSGEFVMSRLRFSDSLGKFCREVWRQLSLKQALGPFHPMVPMNVPITQFFSSARNGFIGHIREMGYTGEVFEHSRWGKTFETMLAANFAEPDWSKASIGRPEVNLKRI